MVISSAMGMNPAVAGHHGRQTDSLVSYFEERLRTELRIFNDRSFKIPNGQIIVVGPDEINHKYVSEQIIAFKADIIVVFGTNILKDPILKACPKILNMHLGMSPYFNGTSTNFWPMYLGILEYIGVTIHYLDAGVDTGDIIGQIRAQIDRTDTPHTIGNKNILAGVSLMKQILPFIAKNDWKGVKQWASNKWPVYRMKDFTSSIETEFIKNINSGAIANWVDAKREETFQMVSFSENGSKIVYSVDEPYVKINID